MNAIKSKDEYADKNADRRADKNVDMLIKLYEQNITDENENRIYYEE